MSPDTRRTIARVLFAIVSLALVAAALYYLLDVFLPFLVGVLVAFLLDPLVKALAGRRLWRGWRIPRGLAVSVVLAFLLAVFFGLGLVAVPRIAREAKLLEAELPGYIDTALARAEEIRDRLLRLVWIPGMTEGEILGRAAAQTQKWLEAIVAASFAVIRTLLTSIPYLVLVPVVAVSLLLDKEAIFRRFEAAVPSAYREKAKEVARSIRDQIGGYVRGKTLDSLVLGAWSGIVAAVFGIKYAALIGIVAGFLNFVPYVGAVLGAIPPLVIALIDARSNAQVTGLAVTLVVLHTLQAYVVAPKIISATARVHVVTTLLVIGIGYRLLGMLGMVIAVPAYVAVRTIVVSLYRAFFLSPADGAPGG
jgi:predicted PurR-regulated permease PerM